MKKVALFFAVVLCTVMFIGCAESYPNKTGDSDIPNKTVVPENPYIAFDPEGVIIKGYLGMTAEQIQAADSAIVFEATDEDEKISKTTDNYTLYYSISNDIVNLAYYIFVYKSLDSFADQTVNCYLAIKNILGPDADGEIKDEEFTPQYLKQSEDTLTGSIAWEVEEYGVRVAMVYTYIDNGVISVLIGKPEGTD